MFEGFDYATFARLLSYPGIDPRQWVSVGIVDPDTPDGRSVRFAEDDGTPLPYPLVNVTLQPNGQQVSARVLSQTSGAGCGSWRAFVPGDEVLVCVPQGDEREGCIIMGRLSNARDKHPTKVAGNDTTQNNIAFDRVMEPIILESGTAIMLRVASVKSFLSLDQTGNVTANCGDGHYLALHADQVGFQTADNSCVVQIDPTAKTLLLQAGETQMVLDDAGQSSFLTSGQLSIVTAGGGYAPGHAVTSEQVLALIAAICASISGPLTGAGIAALLTSGALVGTWATAPLPPSTAAAIVAALKAPPDVTGLKPGVGRPGLLI